MSKPLVIYHANCADGFAAAWVFHKRYGASGVDFYPGVYQHQPPDCAGRDVYLVDFSYKRAVVEQMLKSAQRVRLIDHHATAIDDLDGLEGLYWYTDKNRSGARLAWDFIFYGDPPPPALAHIEDRDLWRFALPFTREIMAAIFARPYTFEVYDELMSRTDMSSLIAEGRAIEMKHHKDVAELVKKFRRTMSIGGHDVPACNIPYTYSSDAGHLMAKGAPFAACYTDTPTGRDFSLRSSGEPGSVDVSEVAKMYGGGGHRNAAGFSVPRDHPLGNE